MARDPKYAERYRQNIKDTLNKGYAELCDSKRTSSPIWYLPHFGVVNPNKPLKLRVVHDAAAESQGVSLNSLLLTGPDLLQPLLDILFRFREGKIAFNADIREMFPQVKIIESDRDAQRFLWRDNPQEPIKTYRMSSMIFGAASSPFTALFLKNKNAIECQDRHPDAAHAIIHDHYMDDYIGSTDNVDHAKQLAADIFAVHQKAGFEMRSWISNEPEALSQLPKDVLLQSSSSVDISLGNQVDPVRTLGLIWQPDNDTIGFNTGTKDKHSLPDKLTKRQVLTYLMRIYDPLGILAPIVVTGRIMFQNLWRKGVDWDEELSQNDCSAWRIWFQDLLSLSQLTIPRRYNLSELELDRCELHVFSDASDSAFAAVAYWRYVYVSGDIKLALIGSKCRVAPLKPTSIPRLELQGALIAARFSVSICEAHRTKVCRKYFWCDSMTVLGWLRSDARAFKPFVSHRVSEILEITGVSEWRWIPSNFNVADDATRLKRAVLSKESRWITGPDFLLSSDSEWPTEPVGSTVVLSSDELRSSSHPLVSFHDHLAIHLINDVSIHKPISADPKRFSSWLRLVRATARAHQYLTLLRLHCLQSRGIHTHNLVRLGGNLLTFCPDPGHALTDSTRPSYALTAQDIGLAELHILRQSQLDSFEEEIILTKSHQPLPKKSRLFNLSPICDEDDLLRLSSRIQAASGVNPSMKSPLILDGKHPAVRLLVERYHRKAGHGNTETVVNELRQQYWILSLRSTVRAVSHHCQFCSLRRATVFNPPMGDLPECRLAHHHRPFTFVGLDYFGPLHISVGRRREKVYVALFTCLVVRAVHLEIVHSLTADAAIMSLRRFVARRGTPTEIWSDNGTAFHGANRELRVLYDDAIAEYAAVDKISWRFIVPSAPFMGGAWERLVRSIKSALRVTLREQAPSLEVLSTLLAEAEALVNSRPLTHVSVDPGSEEALTPSHFLLGSSSGRPIPAVLDEGDMLSRSRWRRAVRLADHFWKRWINEYLPSLVPRLGGGTTPNIVVGDLVLICDGNLPRGSWPRGRVATLFPGRDGITRVADVNTSAGILRRPLRKLVLLPRTGVFS